MVRGRYRRGHCRVGAHRLLVTVPRTARSLASPPPAPYEKPPWEARVDVPVRLGRLAVGLTCSVGLAATRRLRKQERLPLPNISINPRIHRLSCIPKFARIPIIPSVVGRTPLGCDRPDGRSRSGNRAVVYQPFSRTYSNGLKLVVVTLTVATSAAHIHRIPDEDDS